MIGIETALGNLGTAVGGGALAGGATGYAAKKLAKILLVGVGVQFALFAYLDHHGLLDIQWQKLTQALAGVSHSLEMLPPWLTALGATVPVGARFVGEFFLGVKTA